MRSKVRLAGVLAIRIPRHIWQWIAPIVLVLTIFFLARACVQVLAPKPPPVYAPIELKALSVTPDPLIIGQAGTLNNGVCLNQKDPLTVQVYMGLQDATANPLLGVKTVDLVGQDTAEMRKRVTLDSGCRSERIATIVPDTIPPGTWRVIVHIVATGPNGEQQNITEQSHPFGVVAAHLP